MRNFVLIFLFISLATAGTVSAQFVIVAHKDCAIDSLSRKDLHKLFKGQVINAPAAQPLQVVEFEPVSDQFYGQLYGMNSFAVGKHWLRLIFAGERVLPPKNFSDLQRFVDFLLKQKRGVGFLPLATFKQLKSDSLKALVIENKSYLQRGYRLEHD
ncbi:MAG: hypothetical protein DWQ05_07770 [Calditrichaeota bacterium]|nr:MAG: hypothetical protein DWQ05_07770 [Calditrichota bacterium]